MPASAQNKQYLAKLRAALLDTESYATTLITILLDVYGGEAVNWAPETIRNELEDDFKIKLPQLNMDKLMAAIMLLTTDDFYTRLPRFIQLCQVLSGIEADPSTAFSPADAAECAWSLTEAMLISPPEGNEPFSLEIRYYLGHILDDEGIKNPPDMLKLAIRDTNTGQADYGDMSLEDPQMFSAEFQNQLDRGQEISEMIRENLTELMQQLASLQLQNGSTKNVVELAQKHLPR